LPASVTAACREMSTHSNVYISGLPHGTDELALRQWFEVFGSIVSLKCFVEKRYGFIKFTNTDEAQAAIDGMNGSELNGSTLVVRHADNDRGQAAAPATRSPLDGEVAAWERPRT